jgi:two-component system, NarL family, sensor kinase
VQIAEQEIILALIAGSVTLVILTVFFSSLVIIFQKNIRRKQQQLFKAVLETQEKEQQRIGKDLHDEMGPLLSAAKLNLEALKASADTRAANSISYINMLLDEAVKGVRNSAHDLMPSTLEKFGLIAAIEELCSRVNNVGKIKILLEHQDLEETELDPLTRLNIYRIIQEIINNTLKHSGASELLLTFDRRKKNLSITTRDNGVGFNPETARNGIGLRNIESRVKLLNGEYDVKTGPGQGTQVTISFDTEKLR